MNFSELFLNSIELSFEQLGFVRNAREPRFVKIIGEIKFLISFDIDKRSGGRITVSTRLFLIHERCSEIVKSFPELGHKGDYYRTVILSMPILTKLANKAGIPELFFFIKTEEDLNKAIAQTSDFMATEGMNFFEHFKNLESFYHWFNDDLLEGQYDPNLRYPPHDCFEGLIAAKLIKSEVYEKIFIKWKEMLMVEGGKDYLEVFIKLKKFLDSLAV